MHKNTKYLAAVAVLAVGLVSPFMVAAQTSQKSSPRLADIMGALQSRHSKLWTAAQQRNWELAAYELELVKAGLADAIGLYTDIPVTNVTMIDGPLKSLDGAIAARSGPAFGKAFGELTTGCNSCHQSVGRGFIVMTVPTGAPFGNQSFAPRPVQGKDVLRR
ncbi:MAG TPA: hypothetical protein VMT08_23995 [Bradyrhizobium sp.]|nr:hypothetical protein [Bradyrhizobium sp.]